MLFDLRGRGRRNVIKVIYLGLAILMGGGLVLFGIGGNTSGGGLVDAFTDGGGQVGAGEYRDQIRDARADIQADPNDEVAYTDLIRAQVSLANLEGLDQETGAYTEEGKTQLRDAIASWQEYQAIDPKDEEEEASVASRVVQAYAALEDLEGLVKAQEVVALNRESVGTYAALAQYAYLAGQTRKGDLAGKKALELEDADQRQALKSQLDQYKAQAAPAVPSATAEPEASATAEASPEGGPSGGKGADRPKSEK